MSIETQQPKSNVSISLLLNEKSSPSATPNIDSKQYICKQCNQSFTRAHNLKSHLATHSTARPFGCTTCNLHFRRQHDLKRHQKLHTGERPYSCKNCGRSFARMDALNRHQRAELGNDNVIKKSMSLDESITSQSNSSSPTQISTSPKSFNALLPPIKNQNTNSFRSWSSPTVLTSSSHLNPIQLPSPDQLLLPLQEQVRTLIQENNSLKQEMKQISIDRDRLFELEKENKFLKSLIHQQKEEN